MADFEVDDGERRRVRALVAGAVRIRFALDADAFVVRLLALAARLGEAGVAPSILLARFRIDDLYLATACAIQDEDAWAEFVTRYREFIHRFAGRILRAPASTDLADEVIADLWERRKIARFEGRSSLKTWLGTVVSHAAINASNTAKTREQLAGRPIVRAVDPAAGIEAAERSTELARLLAESIARQPTPDRLLILLYYEQGLTLDEIRPIMGLSKAALSRRLKRIRDALLETTDALASRRLGTSARSLAEGLSLSAVELDLRAACHLAAEWRPTDSV